MKLRTKLFMVLMILAALPVMIPVELACRIVAPEHRWSKYPAFHEVFDTRYARSRRST